MVRFTDAQPWLVIEMLTIIPINNEKIVKCISNLHLIIHEEVLRCSIQNQNWDVVVLFHNKHNCIFIRNREERLGCCVGQTPAQDKTMYYVSESTIKIYFTLNEKTIQNVHSPSHIWNSYWFHDSFGDLINNFYWTCISQFIFHLTPTASTDLQFHDEENANVDFFDFHAPSSRISSRFLNPTLHRLRNVRVYTGGRFEDNL